MLKMHNSSSNTGQQHSPALTKHGSASFSHIEATIMRKNNIGLLHSTPVEMYMTTEQAQFLLQQAFMWVSICSY